MKTLAIILLATAPAWARNIDLSTVPSRDTVQLTIYNAEDLTLVRETRHVTFKKGVNPLQFSWANTLIDPTSVTLRFPKQAAQLEVLDTTYPLDKPQMLYWNVEAGGDMEAVAEISYFTSGITWSADYVCITDPGETVMDVTGFVRVFNHSGEEYENAQVRLVVGTINLVEKIAELAQRQYGKGIEQLEEGVAGAVRKLAAKDKVAEVANALAPAATSAGVPKKIEKEGLGEYFIYTVEGTETIQNGWSKRLRSFDGRQIPFKIQYRYRPAEYGDQLVRMFLLRNDAESKLGTTPLPDGIVRVYRDNGKDGLGFRVQQQIKYVPIGDKIELNLGPDPEVVHEWVKLKTWREHIWFQRQGLNVYKEYGGGTKLEINDVVVGWEDHVGYAERIRNYRPRPIEVELRRTFPGDVAFISKLEPARHDYQTVQLTASCPAGKKTELTYHVRTRQGHLAKQQNVTIERGG
ncbi:MAG TPA: hypothetical protein PKY77_08400 [Phycisphaerae bacterium]|nr:hypothetical protein [Phycisphaerae bacterium]HRY68713.1 hypothetical protein [Phycisphaerae bacterium]HSA25539.1 hypothetical protein [Phycisphaerae bacterium]